MKRMIYSMVAVLTLFGSTGCTGGSEQETTTTVSDVNSAMKCQVGKCGDAKEAASKAVEDMKAEEETAKE